MAFAVAASTFCPLLVLGIWWRGLTTAGAISGLIVGGGLSRALVTSVALPGVLPDALDSLLGQPAARFGSGGVRDDDRRVAADQVVIDAARRRRAGDAASAGCGPPIGRLRSAGSRSTARRVADPARVGAGWTWVGAVTAPGMSGKCGSSAMASVEGNDGLSCAGRRTAVPAPASCVGSPGRRTTRRLPSVDDLLGTPRVATRANGTQVGEQLGKSIARPGERARQQPPAGFEGTRRSVHGSARRQPSGRNGSGSQMAS